LLCSSPIAAHLVVHRSGKLHIGEDVTIGAGCGIACHSEITIGDRTRLGAYVMVLDSDYHVAGKPSERAASTPIHIGRDVSIGSQCTILRGSRIEDAAIVEPGSVVSGIVPAGIHIGGVPARPLRGMPHSTKPVSIEIGVLTVAQRTFRLPKLPSLSDGPEQIPHWDSLGALSFLLALEDRFSVTLNPDETAHVQALREIVDLVQGTLDRRAARRMDTLFARPGAVRAAG
jgi:carbonic anhydrase/acetyltransferase-like protein (isoleucine patch superfamily)